MKYRRKSLEVEAIKYRIGNLVEIENFIKELDSRNKILPTFSASSLIIDTPDAEGVIEVRLFDYLVKEDKTLYASTREVFEELFEKVDENDSDIEC